MTKLQINKLAISMIVTLALVSILFVATVAKVEPARAMVAAVATTARPPTATLVPGDIAQNKYATGSAACTTSQMPWRAVDGLWAVGSNSKWCSTAASKWWQVDLGGIYDITQIRIYHAGMGGESSALNTYDFQILISMDNTSWELLAERTGNTKSHSIFPVTMRRARYIKLNIINGTQPGQDNAARIYEVTAMGTLVVSYPTLTPFSTPTRSASATPVR